MAWMPGLKFGNLNSKQARVTNFYFSRPLKKNDFIQIFLKIMNGFPRAIVIGI
jgi:hypothetical protein